MSRFLEGRVAVVTGAAHGIGAACARVYAEAGAVVVVSDVDAAGGAATAAAIGATFLRCDVARAAECAALVREVVARHGRIDILHANAGIELCRSIWDTTDEEWDRIVAINLSGSFWCARDAMKAMRAAGTKGVVTLTASPHAFLTSREIAAYAATKAGQVGLMRAMALEGAPYGIRVNAVLPGATDTPMLQREAESSGDPAALLATFAAAQPMGRLVRPEEVARVAAFLASDAASGVTGSCVAADGGLMAAINAGAGISYTGETPALIPPVTEGWRLTKPAASGKRGVVVAQCRAGAEAGIAILDAGGNAVDAAVGTAMALASQEPWNSGLGGYGGFAVVHRAGEARAEVVDFGPVSPRGLTTDAFRLTGRMSETGFRWPEVEGDANIHGPLAAAVPAAVAGCEALHTRWGRLPVAEVMAPAVALARQGLRLDWFAALKIAAAARDLRRYAETARIYLRDGLPPVPPAEGNPGTIPLGNLAATMERLARAGWRDFYEGEIAAAFVRDQKAVGGVIDAGDLRACAARVVPALQVPWRGGRTLQLADGMTATPAMLPVLEAMREADYGAMPDAAWYRRLAAAARAAYATRLDAPRERNGDTCTTHLTVCDAEGTMVAMTTTLMASFGSRVVLPETGMMMNNGIMLFDPRPGRAASLAPGKRALTNMAPFVLREGDAPMMAGGASGGRHIMAAVFQLMSYVADFAMDPEAAAHAPRISVAGPDRVAADAGLGEATMSALAQDGPVDVVRRTVMPANFANPNLVVRGADGTATGIADDRSPWSAALAR